MEHEEVVASTVQLAYPINVKDREGNDETLATVGDAASFLLVNFNRPRSADIDWKLAASALERAANAVIALLETEKLIRRCANHGAPLRPPRKGLEWNSRSRRGAALRLDVDGPCGRHHRRLRDRSMVVRPNPLIGRGLAGHASE